MPDDLPDQLPGDPLAQRFAAFRESSSTATRPPGADAVIRTVHRRQLSRTVAAGVALTLAALVAFVLWRPTGRPEPARTPPTAAPSTSGPAPNPTAAATATSTPTPTPTLTGGSGSPSGTASTATTGSPARCGIQPQVIGGDPLSVAPDNYFQRCPDARIRIYSVTYEWSAAQQQYVRTRLTNLYFTATSPTLPLPEPDLNPIASSCGYLFFVVYAAGDPPSSLPVSYTDAPDMAWPMEHLGNLLLWTTSTHTLTDQQKVPSCRRTSGSVTP
ncbi:hypothetical protein [Dactylosporangium sp. NPDC050588]|uniref:hypothetical protein n=1 Tax=Dactylosporangium sp. NPDC050588 TaxID=3157211 RepID=UPI00340B5433